VTPLRLRVALAAYLRSLQALDSRFDRAVRGDTLALATAERRGLTVFVGKGKCGTCHFVPLFSGVIPPTFIEAEPEVIGVPDRPTTSAGALDADVGRYAIDRIEPHRHAFKTPTLRNVALTAPYMHNGVYRTLEQVVDFYDRGGGHGIGAAVDNRTLPTTRLRLTTTERRDLVSFLRALTDTAGLTSRPAR
jgi:cytochrome c peroxidase